MLNNAEKVCKKGKDMRKKETSEVTDRLIKYKAYLMTKTDGWIECFGWMHRIANRNVFFFFGVLLTLCTAFTQINYVEKKRDVH